MGKNTLIVNFLGGPGCGKSTMAASVFSELKWRGIDAEYTTEYAKDKVWEESMKTLENQLYVLGKQEHRIFRVNGKLDVVVTDSAVLMSMIYSRQENHKTELFRQLVVNEFTKYNNMNFFLIRTKYYKETGRYQTFEEAKSIDGQIKNILDGYDISYEIVETNRDNVNYVVDKIVKYLEDNGYKSK